MEIEQFLKKSNPNLALDIDLLQKVLQHLTVIGVQCVEDLAIVKEKDLLEVMPPIKARRLIQKWSCHDTIVPLPSASLISSPAVTAPTPSTPVYTATWIDTFALPTTRLSKKLNDLLVQGKRLDPSSRRDFVRVVVDDIFKCCPKPLKRHTDIIARKMVETYARSLCDKVGEEVMMGGFQSLAKQLKARVENVHRKDPPSDSLLHSTCQSGAARKRKLDFGCVNSQPTVMPEEESEDSLRRRQALLQEIFNQGERVWVREEIENHMKLTYILQRKDLNINSAVTEVIKEWPFLFNEFGMLMHFELLTGIRILECLEDSGKVEKLWAFLKSSNVTKYKPIFKDAARSVLEDVKESQESKNTILPAAILSLMAYFSEQADTLFIRADETAAASEVRDLPSTPCLIFCGSSCFVARRFMLSVDKVVVNDNITTFLVGFVSLFGSFFCLNIQYPQAAAATLDFIQRCFFKINPERGSRVEKAEKKKKYNLNPKVVTLFQSIADFEWMN